MTVLILKAEDEARQMVSILTSAGFTTLCIPVIQTIKTEFAQPNLSLYQALLFTSQHAVRHFFENLTQPCYIPCYAINATTYRQLQKYSHGHVINFHSKNASDFAHRILNNIHLNCNYKYLFVKGWLSLNTLKTELVTAKKSEKSNIICDEICVYDVVPVKSNAEKIIAVLEQKENVSLIFFSPSAVDFVSSIHNINSRLDSLFFCAIGATTANRIYQKLHFKPTLIASKPNMKIFAMEIVKLLTTHTAPLRSSNQDL